MGSKISWLKTLSSLDEVMILINELWDVLTCFRIMVRMMETYGCAVPERKGHPYHLWPFLILIP